MTLLALGLAACSPVSIWVGDTAGPSGPDTATEHVGSEGTETIDGGEQPVEDIVGPGDTSDTGDGGGGEPNHEADLLFGPDAEVHTFEISLSDEAFLSLVQDPYEYVEGSITWGDTHLEQVGVRVKGQNSFEPITEKSSFKIKIDWIVDDQRFLGLSDLQFNNAHDDYTMLHERLGYWIFNEAGVPSARSGHAWIIVNGVEYGLYANTEVVDKRLLRHWYDDEDGPLYEGWDVDFYSGYINSYQHESGEDDRSALWALAASLQQGDAYEAADEFLNWDEFVNFWATTAVIGQFDAYPYSSPGDDYHVYINPDNDNKIDFLPHGNDECFSSFSSTVESVNGIVAQTCKADPTCREAFRARVFEVLDITEKVDWVSGFEQIQAQIQPYVEADTRKRYSTSSVATYQAGVESWVNNRRAEMERQLQ